MHYDFCMFWITFEECKSHTFVFFIVCCCILDKIESFVKSLETQNEKKNEDIDKNVLK